MEYLKAFLVGGLLCLIGQLLIDTTKLTPARILTAYVVAGVVLGGVGVYQYLVDFGGAGATVPLTGFGYNLAKGVREAVDSEGLLGALLGGILGVSRTTLAMARDRHLPAPLAAVHATRRTPYVAEICVGVLVAVIVLLADVRQAIGFSSFAVLVYYLVANTAALRLDRRRRRLPAWVPVLGAIGCVTVAGSLPWESVVGGVVVFVVGGAVYAVTRRGMVQPAARSHQA